MPLKRYEKLNSRFALQHRYYEDDDFHLFDEDWLVAPIYAKRFVKMSKKGLKDILKDSCASSTLCLSLTHIWITRTQEY